ncbi:MAG: hypothetical protein IT180_14715 [Acidobacteria bacterium]|nr:hypothetical protein [Acidobacteriota bacterium]
MSDRAPSSEPPTRKEIDAAERLGIGLSLYRQFKKNAGSAADTLEEGEGPADIVAEDHLYQKMRIRPGVFKARHTAPSVFVAAARTPGEVARSLLTIVCYLAFLFLIVGFGGDTVQRVPGVFQVFALVVMVIPAMMLSAFVWERVGENVRDVVRALVRFWPLTLLVLLFALGLIRLLLG